MKQLLIKQGQVTVEDVPAPLIESGHVLVEVAYSLISTGTELSSVQGSGKSLVQRAIEQPEKIQKVIDHLRRNGITKTIAKVQEKVSVTSPTGYSCSGIVIQVGEGVEDIRPGDQVACAGAGIANHAEIVVVPRNLTVKVPDGCDLKQAASVTLGAIALQGVRRADPRLGDIVAVIGLGLLGQLTVQLLKAAGCQVIGLDVDPRRVEVARQLGADWAFNSTQIDVPNEIRHITADHGADSTIITAASQSDALAQQAMEITRKKGRVVVVGLIGMGLKRSPFYEKEIDFLISTSYGPGRYDERYEIKGQDYPYAYVRWTENRNMSEYLRLISAGSLRLDLLLEREYELSQADRAYIELSEAVEKPLGIILKYPASGNTELARKLGTRVNLQPGQASGKIRVALVGAGNFARSMHLPNLKQLSELYQLEAVVDTNGSNAQIVAKEFNAAYASTNFEDVVSDPHVDAVMICTRHYLHAPMAMQAARAGKAVFVEKPMAMNCQELDELVSVLQETKMPYMVGFNRRYSPASRRLKELTQDRQNPLMMLYRVNAGYIPADNWVQTGEGGGRMVGEACHFLDMFQYLAGSARPNCVDTTHIAPSNGHLLADDNTCLSVQYSDGSVGTLFYTAMGHPALPKEYLEVYSEGKVLVLHDYTRLQVIGSPQKGWTSSTQDKGHLDELKSFASYMRGEIEAPVSLSEYIETTKISFKAAGLER